MTAFRWLHLSDFHVGAKAQDHLWPTVREEFLADLRRLLCRRGPVDIVVLSGDLSQSGKKDEFDRFDDLISEILAVVSEETAHMPVLFAVPGNHDLRRPPPTRPEARVLSRWADEPAVQQEFWADSSSPYRLAIADAFANFSSWYDGHVGARPVVRGLVPGDSSIVISKDGLKFGFAGMNSSFLQLDDADWQRRLTIDARQFNAATGGDGARWARDCDYCWLVTHHPPDWLSTDGLDTLRADISPPGRFVAQLFGHMHEAAAVTISEGGAPSRRFVQSPSLFGLRTFGRGVERSHGYTLGELIVREDGPTFRVWPRAGRKVQSGQWSVGPDPGFVLTGDEGTSPDPSPTPTGRSRPLPPADAPADVKNPMLRITLGALAEADCRRGGLDTGRVVSFVAREAKNHPRMFEAPFQSVPVPFEDLVVLLSCDGDRIDVERVLARPEAYPAMNSWASTLLLYRRCTLLPYRTQGAAALSRAPEPRRTVELYGALMARATAFLRATKQVSESDAQAVCGARDLIDEACLALESPIPGLGVGIGRLEAALSQVHKLLVRHAPSISPGRPQSDAQDSGTSDPTKPAILVVDDEPANVRSFTRALSNQRWTVFTAEDGRSALAAIVQRDFAVVVTDLWMPGVDGFGVLAACHAISPRIKTIVLTGHLRAYREMAPQLRERVDVFLVKPPSAAELVASVGRLVAEWEAQIRHHPSGG